MEKPMWRRVIQALRNERGGRITGRFDLQKAVFPSGQWTLDDTRVLNLAITFLLDNHLVQEEKTQIPGTGNEGPPVFEYTYKIDEGRTP